jgi:hypothetical protein
MLTKAQAKVPHYRRTKSGEWVVCGPTSLVKRGAVVTVTKRDGTTKDEKIVRVGKPFRLAGIECCYGYLSAPPRRLSPRAEAMLRAAGVL